MGGPQAMLGWLLGAALAICDGMVWSELASAIPTSGGTFEYLKVAYAGTPLRRMLPFLFIWQFVLSGPLEVASGYIGFAQYAGYIFPLGPWGMTAVAVAVGLLVTFLLYRKIEAVGKLMVLFWAGMMLTVAVVLAAGLSHFQAAVVFDFPPGAFTFSRGFVLGLGSATVWAMYDFFGYYSVCYIGDEVADAPRTIPRSILISVVSIALIYLAMNISIISVVPWRDAMKSQFIAAEFMERLYGRTSGVIVAVLICWTAVASVFALLLGYSRILYAAARDGFFFPIFGRLHPRGDFPHVSLLVLGAVAAGASFFSLDEVISALISTRIVVQFIAQIGAVALLRRQAAAPVGFRMAWYPLPSLLALLGWLFVLACSGVNYILGGLGPLALGACVYFVWSRRASIPAVEAD